MRWHEEVLGWKETRAAEILGQALGDTFFLAGGTGLALQLGHRISLDLDMFSSSRKLQSAERRDIFEALRARGSLKVVTSEDHTCHLVVDGANVSLFFYPEQMLRKPCGNFRGLAVAHVEDICAMKLNALVGRGSRKDFIDLYFLFRKLGTAAAIGTAERKFRDHADFPAQAVRALVYFMDAEKEPMPKMLASMKWEEIKRFFEIEVRRYLRAEVAS